MPILEYNVGDRVVHPLHGAGIIVSKSKNSVLGEEQDYYILNILVGSGIKVMVPTAKASTVGLRKVIMKSEIDTAFKELLKSKMTVDSDVRWNKRHRDNMDKIKSGNFSDVLWVFMSLVLRSLKRDLSTGERKVLTTAKNIVTSELILANNMTQEQAESLLNQYAEILAEANLEQTDAGE